MSEVERAACVLHARSHPRLNSRLPSLHYHCSLSIPPLVLSPESLFCSAACCLVLCCVVVCSAVLCCVCAVFVLRCVCFMLSCVVFVVCLCAVLGWVCVFVLCYVGVAFAFALRFVFCCFACPALRLEGCRPPQVMYDERTSFCSTIIVLLWVERAMAG